MRRLIPATAITLALTSVSTMAATGGLMDTATLGQLCREDKSASTMYVMGVVEQAYLSKTAKFCIKKGQTMVQARDLICRYIAEEATKEMMPLSAAAITNEVLGLDWPCP